MHYMYSVCRDKIRKSVVRAVHDGGQGRVMGTEGGSYAHDGSSYERGGPGYERGGVIS